MNIMENSDIMQYIDSLDDSRIKELLNKMHFEYSEYQKIGTVEEVCYYKTLCETKPIDFANFTRDAVRHFKDELEFEKRKNEKPKRKVGRPRKCELKNE